MATPKQVSGQFMHALINDKTEKSDPWQRNYNAPPPVSLTPRTYPLNDLRPLLSASDYSPSSLLQSHGFGVVKHHSVLQDKLISDQELPTQTLNELYHPEMRDLIKSVTGAKTVFIMTTVLRQGKRDPGAYKLPVGISFTSDTKRPDGVPAQPQHKLTGQPNLALAAPVRIPHMDLTPLGARQTIRKQAPDIHDAAVASGVIAAEDSICSTHGVDPMADESNPFVAREYNKDGNLGPRYAGFSVWRPLHKVSRDPLSVAPRKTTTGAGVGVVGSREKVYHPYKNRIKAVPGLGGDYLREYAMLGVNVEEEAEEADDDGADALKWYYVAEQEPDEVLFIKLFDSAALGDGAQHMGAPWHGSPDIGDVYGDQPRESIELRVIAFW